MKVKVTILAVVWSVVPVEIWAEEGEGDTAAWRIALEEVEIMGKSPVEQVREMPYNVVAIDGRMLHNTTMDLGHALDRISGAKLRQTGGVGSAASFSLNGFTGRHVKFFLDGVPMEGMGQAFQINNIPVNLAERIEVYKGVVPIRFGADALGGVVNIVTGGRRKQAFVDASYSAGSFNTHKGYINAGATAKNGLTLQLNAFVNYSDNNYPVYTQVLNLQTNTYSKEEMRVKRFHDKYRNGTVIVKAGVTGKPFADRLMVGLTVGDYRADIQNSNIMKVVFGERYREGSTLMPSLQWIKRGFVDGRLDAELTGNYNRNVSENTDTSSLRYNWLGEAIPTGKKGEANYSVSRYVNENWSGTGNAGWKITPAQSVSVNNVLTYFSRDGSNSVAMTGTINATDTFPKTTLKNISAVDYSIVMESGIRLSVFGKHYLQRVTGPRNVSTSTNSSKYEIFSSHSSTWGYGGAGSYVIGGDWQAKVSYEKTYRLPTSNELFGNEDLEKSNAGLRPEYSHNYNAGVSYTGSKGEHRLFGELAVAYRDVRDYIRRVVESMHYTATYENHGHVRNMGVNGEVRYSWKDFSAGGTLTYQDVRNREKYRSSTSTVVSTSYKARVPNQPYLFGNADASWSLPGIGGKENMLTLGYNTFYVHSFPLRWGVNGFPETKDVVPTQWSHDITATWGIAKGRYNVSLECHNLTDVRLYDNFSLQKPGRSFSVKVRVYMYSN
jgi:outer membrane cobalamin receptor